VNALRHGKPPVRVRSRIGDTVCLCVEDSGYGVPPDFVPQLFERFSRSAASRRSDTNGVGLGLSIARSYAEALGASLYYEPAEPRGARFVVELHDVAPAPQTARQR
jgi:signal transduction histidine kinase